MGEEVGFSLPGAAGWGTGDDQGVWPDSPVPHLSKGFHPSRCTTLEGRLAAKRAAAQLLHCMV